MLRRKHCRKCNRERLSKFFTKDCSKSDGLRAYCKNCTRSDYQNYYRSNRVKVLESTNKYKRDNKDYYDAYFSEYREINREGLRAKNREYYQKNRAKVLERTKKWGKDNKGRRAVIDHRYRAKKLNQMGEVSS